MLLTPSALLVALLLRLVGLPLHRLGLAPPSCQDGQAAHSHALACVRQQAQTSLLQLQQEQEWEHDEWPQLLSRGRPQ